MSKSRISSVPAGSSNGIPRSFIDEALEQCGKTRGVYADAMPISGRALETGLAWLAKAERLSLDVPLIPAGEEERKVASLDEYGAGLDAPWQITAIEYEHGGVYDVRRDFTRALSTRRIALCVVIPDTLAPLEQASPGELSSDESSMGALLVWPITYFDEKREWEFAPGVVIVDRAQASQQLEAAANQFLALTSFCDAKLRRLLGAKSAEPALMMRYQPMMPELCAKLGEEHAEKMIRESSFDALWVALGTFAAMSCTNVFIRQETRRLTLSEGRGARIALDPFRGHRALRWNGRSRWLQAGRLPMGVSG